MWKPTKRSQFGLNVTSGNEMILVQDSWLTHDNTLNAMDTNLLDISFHNVIIFYM